MRRRALLIVAGLAVLAALVVAWMVWPDTTPGVTAPNFLCLRPGMTTAEVERALGEAGQPEESEFPGTYCRTWDRGARWSPGSFRVVLYFRQGTDALCYADAIATGDENRRSRYTLPGDQTVVARLRRWLRL